MNQDKEAAVAELKELTQELEEMGNYFNQDGVIDASEQAMLDEMKKEIDSLKGEMREMEGMAKQQATNIVDGVSDGQTLEKTGKELVNNLRSILNQFKSSLN